MRATVPPVGRLLLVRHGQASFGAEDYDVLSPVGHEQAAAVGRHLAAAGVVPDVVLAGGLRRQQDTAAGAVTGAGWSAPVETDPRWDEFDHLVVTHAYGDGDMRTMDRRGFQVAFEAATARWTAGDPPDPEAPGAVEPFADFVARVRDALADATRRTGPGATAVVVSSGGVIAVAAALLLGADGPALPAVWSRLNTVLVNTGTSTVVVGATGPRLLSFNEHTHLSRDAVTYR